MKIREIRSDEPLERRHISVRPTRLGIALLLVAAAAWTVALNYSVNLAYFLAFWILSFALWAMLQSFLQLHGASIHLLSVAECFAGESARLTLNFSGSRFLNQNRIYLRFLLPEDVRQHFAVQDWQLPDAAGNVVLEFPALRRGRNGVPVLSVYTHAPFALLAVSTHLQYDWQITVYPQPAAHDLTLLREPAEGRGGNVIRRRGEGDIAFLAEYRPGDALKQISWKHYARSRKLLSKHQEEESGTRPDYISWRDYPAGSSTDALASWLCQRVLAAAAAQQNYILELPHSEIPPQNGQREKALTALALW